MKTFGEKDQINPKSFFGVPFVPIVAGHTWTQVVTGFEGSKNFRDISFVSALNQWVLGLNSPLDSEILTSPDGVTWSLVDIDPGGPSNRGIDGSSLGFGAGVFCVSANQSGASSNKIMYTSADLVTWTRNILPLATFDGFASASAPVFGNGIFLSVDISGFTTDYATSSDGNTWTAQNTYVPTAWNAAPFFDGTQFIASVFRGSDGLPAIATSLDGVTWVEQNPFNTLVSPGQIAFNGTLYVVCDISSDNGENGATVANIINPVSFNDGGLGTFGFTWGGGSFVGVNDNGTDPAAFSSTDGNTWSTDTTNVGGSSVNSVAFGQGKFLASGFAPSFLMTRAP